MPQNCAIIIAIIDLINLSWFSDATWHRYIGDLGQHCFRKWPVAWWHQAIITWINQDDVIKWKLTFSTLLDFCAGNSPVTSEFPSQRPVTWSFDVFFNLHLKKQLSKQSRRRWFEMPLHSLWHHGDDVDLYHQGCSVAFTWERFHKKCSWN